MTGEANQPKVAARNNHVCVSLERVGILDHFLMATPSPPHRDLSSVWFYNHFSLSVVWGYWTTFRWRKELKLKRRVRQIHRHQTASPPHRTPSSAFHSLLCKLGGSGTKYVRARPTPIEPQQCFSLSSLQALNKTCLGPSHKAVIFTLFSVVPTPGRPRPTRTKGSGYVHHPRRPGASLTFMQEDRF